MHREGGLGAATVPKAVAPTTTTSGTPPSRITISIDVTTSTAAKPRPKTRGVPLRINPYHAAVAAPTKERSQDQTPGKAGDHE